jgi:hypothetical protein
MLKLHGTQTHQRKKYSRSRKLQLTRKEVWSAELNEKFLSSVFVIFRVVNKLVEWSATYKYLKN